MSETPPRLPKHRPHPKMVWLVTWFGLGLLPKAPGTWGSLGALPCAWGLYALGGTGLLILATGGLFFCGLVAVKVYLEDDTDSDPKEVVIDEVAGQWLTLIPVAPDPILYTLGFLLFRVFDIIKPWPVGWADKNLKGAWGVMIDDILAGLYAAIIIFTLDKWIG